MKRTILTTITATLTCLGMLGALSAIGYTAYRIATAQSRCERAIEESQATGEEIERKLAEIEKRRR